MSHNHTPVSPYHPSGTHVPSTVTKNKLPLFIQLIELYVYVLTWICLVSLFIGAVALIMGEGVVFLAISMAAPIFVFILKMLIEIWKKLDSPVKEHVRAENI